MRRPRRKLRPPRQDRSCPPKEPPPAPGLDRAGGGKILHTDRGVQDLGRPGCGCGAAGRLFPGDRRHYHARARHRSTGLFVGPLGRDETGVALLQVRSLGFKEAFLKN
ncbi:MAG: hypothetical protein MZU97_18925 [Bacillus subtilis]|nr:hypothetical protein [Bacillus subtilis]